MKTTTKSVQAEAPSAYEITPELNAAIQAVHAAFMRRKNLDDAVNALPKMVSDHEQDVMRLSDELAASEAQLALSSGDQAKKLEHCCELLSAALSKKENELKRTKLRVIALEGLAPEIDAAVEEAGSLLNIEVGILAGAIKSQIASEMREAVLPVLAVMAKAQAANLNHQFREFLLAAYLPDPESFMSLGGFSGAQNYSGINLLESNISNPDATAIARNLKPIKDALGLVKLHAHYVPLAKRPIPYQIKGTIDGLGGKPGIHPRPAPTPALVIDASITQAPYIVKGSSGNASACTPQELNPAYQPNEFAN